MSWPNYFEAPTWVQTSAQNTTTGLGTALGAGNTLAAYYGTGLQQQAQMQQNALNALSAGKAPRSTAWTHLTEADLSNEAFNTPVETLVNLWLARYGDAWIDKSTVLGEKFFEITAQRLIRLSRMEEYTVIDNGNNYYKSVLRVVA